jgi:hypothetical protein
MTTKSAPERAKQIVENAKAQDSCDVYDSLCADIAAEFEKDAIRIEELEAMMRQNLEIKKLAANRIAALEAKLATCSQFTFGHPMSSNCIEVIKTHWEKNTWKVKRGSNVLNNVGKWEYEMMPSSRDDEFLDRTRYDLDTAIVLARQALSATEDKEFK